jgi:hypothetical protein
MEKDNGRWSTARGPDKLISELKLLKDTLWY